MLADISGLIGLIVFGVIALISALLKRKQEPEEFELPPELKPRRDRPSPPPPTRSWEEELRKLLEGQPLPPPIGRQAPPPLPPVAAPEPGHEFLSESEEPHIEVSMRPPKPRLEPTFRSMGGLTESASHYADATHLQERVTQHLADVTRHRVGTTSVVRREASVDARDLVAELQNPRTVRRAVLAAIVLGPPRALES